MGAASAEEAGQGLRCAGLERASRGEKAAQPAGCWATAGQEAQACRSSREQHEQGAQGESFKEIAGVVKQPVSKQHMPNLLQESTRKHQQGQQRGAAKVARASGECGQSSGYR